MVKLMYAALASLVDYITKVSAQGEVKGHEGYGIVEE